MSSIEDRYQKAYGGPGVWAVIREIYDTNMPDILATRAAGKRRQTNPYYVDWQFTPIEQYAWMDIRSIGLPLYPQVPVDRYFIDFADPYLKIGVELDGKDFHSAENDQPRDRRLWNLGWRIYRIPGRNSLPEPRKESDARDEIATEDRNHAYREWGMRWSEGFFWALNVYYYAPGWATHQDRATAYGILDSHRGIEFPVELHPEDDES